MIKTNGRTVKFKLWALSSTLLANMLVVGGLSFWIARELAGQLTLTIGTDVPVAVELGKIGIIAGTTRANTLSAIIAVQEGAEDRLNELQASNAGLETEFNEAAQRLDSIELPPAMRAKAGPALDAVRGFQAFSAEIMKDALGGRAERAFGRVPDFHEKFKAAAGELDQLEEEVQAHAGHTKERAHDLLQFGNLAGTLSIVIGIILNLALSWALIRSLQAALQKTVRELTESTASLTGSSRALNQGSQRLASATTEQSSALQETAASVDQITAMVKVTSDNAKNLEHASGESNQSALRGRESVKQMLAAMEGISKSNAEIMEQVEDGNRKIAEIVKVIGEIGSKTKVINDIVFQTKLLSFNASVEAARAGEHGKGFAVVAEEVGNLAQMSGNAAKEISEMLHSSIQRVEGIVTDNKRNIGSIISQGKDRIVAGGMIAKDCGLALDDIVRYSDDVGRMINEITSAIGEQNQGIQEISKAIQLLDQATQENAVVSQDTSNTSSALLAQAGTLEQIIHALRAMVDSSAGGMPAPEAPVRDPSPASASAKVVSLSALQRKGGSQRTLRPVDVKKAAGDGLMPSGMDPRFEDM